MEEEQIKELLFKDFKIKPQNYREITDIINKKIIINNELKQINQILIENSENEISLKLLEKEMPFPGLKNWVQGYIVRDEVVLAYYDKILIGGMYVREEIVLTPCKKENYMKNFNYCETYFESMHEKDNKFLFQNKMFAPKRDAKIKLAFINPKSDFFKTVKNQIPSYFSKTSTVSK